MSEHSAIEAKIPGLHVTETPLSQQASAVPTAARSKAYRERKKSGQSVYRVEAFASTPQWLVEHNFLKKEDLHDKGKIGEGISYLMDAVESGTFTYDP